jgi:biopolymer transport protein ExbD
MARRLTGSTTAAASFHAINLTPMVPVLLALFAVIAVSGAPSEAALPADMPGCTMTGPDYVEPPRTAISILGEGRYAIGGETVDASRLAERARTLTAAHGASRIYIQATADTPYGEILSVTSALKDTGLAIVFDPRWIAT